ncbi:hypothetical protein ACIBKY_14350 [Nonomuraea sp. NPDC050394]|uniref:hypothetical protein n=1 Tax=Nonomuraea sp. NPDC050394 TaxID=3364363 RepID=UPI0037B42EC2
MRHSSAAVTVVAAVLAAGWAAAPAAAHTGAAPEARAAWITSCTDKQDVSYPCGQWRLIMRDGRTVTVPGAAAAATDGKGVPQYQEAPFAVSGDGRWIGYLRASDHRLVVRRATGGRVTALPKSLTPRASGSMDLTLRLSPHGDRIAIDHTDGDKPGKIVTVRTGATVNLPADDVPQAFSSDGDELLATRNLTDNTTALVVHHTDGRSPLRRTPPQVVGAAGVYALAADGRNVAALIPGDYDGVKPPRLREYDMTSGEMGPSLKLAAPKGHVPAVASYDRDGGLGVLFYQGESGTGHAWSAGVDTSAGTLTKRDRYTISAARYAARLAGE